MFTTKRTPVVRAAPAFAAALSLFVTTAAALAQVPVPSPALLVVNKAENSLAVVDPGSGRRVKSIPTGEGPHEVAVSADGRTAYVTNYGAQAPGNSLSVIDLAAGRETRRVDLGALRRPHGLMVSGTAVYFTIEGSRAVARYDPGARVVDWIMGTGEGGTHMVVGTPDGSLLFTSNIASDSVTAMQRPAGSPNWAVARILVGKGPEGIDLSPDGKQLWTAHSRDGGVSIIDAATATVIATMDIRTKRSNRVRFTPDGRHVLVSDLDAGELIVIDAAARKELRRIAVGKAPSGILVVPDGSRAYVALTGEHALAVVDLETWEVTGRVPTGAGPDGMAWIAR